MTADQTKIVTLQIRNMTFGACAFNGMLKKEDRLGNVIEFWRKSIGDGFVGLSLG
jgi:hypothetical protein